MMDYDFEIKYLKGELIPADYLSKNVLESVDIFQTIKLTYKKMKNFVLCFKVLKGWDNPS